MITKDDVIYGYKLILGREPESEEAIAYHCQHENLMELRKALLNSDEFKQQSLISLPSNTRFVEWHDLVEHKIVFLHAPKTAGTSFSLMLGALFPTHKICPERFNRLQELTAKELSSYTLFTGHFDLISTMLIPGNKKIVSIFRDPLSRLISLYNFLKSHKPDVITRNNWKVAELAQLLEIEDFYSHPAVKLHPYFNNGMTRMLSESLSVDIWPCEANLKTPLEKPNVNTAIENLKYLTAYGIQEQFEQSTKHIFSAIGLPAPKSTPKAMTFEALSQNQGNYKKIEPAESTDRLIDVTKELIETDTVLYSTICSRLSSALPSGHSIRTPSINPSDH